MPCFIASLAFFLSCFSLIERLGFFFSLDVRSPLGIVDLLVVVSCLAVVSGSRARSQPAPLARQRTTGSPNLSRGHSRRSEAARTWRADSLASIESAVTR